MKRRCYYISNHGRVLSIRILADGTESVMEMKLQTNEDGYKKCTLNCDRKTNSILVHRVVLMAFGPAPDGDISEYHCNHEDHDNAHNHISNLRWLTPLENLMHRRKYKMPQKFHSQNTLDHLPLGWEYDEYKTHPNHSFLQARHRGVLLANRGPVRYYCDKGY